MNKTKKILSIILITLLIISTVFTLCKKIGLCADSSESGYLFYPNIEVYNSDFVRYYPNIVSTIEPDFDTSGDYANLIYINAIEDSTLNGEGYTHVLMLSKYSTTTNYSYFGGSSSSSWNGGYKINPNSGGSQPTYENYNTLGPSYIYYYRNGSYPSAGITHLKYYLFKSSDGSVVATQQSFSNKFANRLCLYKDNDDNFDSFYMPIYCDHGIANVDNKIYGVSVVDSGSGGNGSDSPGFSSDYMDAYQQNVTDTSSGSGTLNGSTVSDPTSLIEWAKLINDNIIAFFQRSIASAKTINDTVVNGFNWLGSQIQNAFNGLVDKLTEFFTSILTWYDIFNELDELLTDTEEDTSQIASNTTGVDTFVSDFWDDFDDHLGDAIDGLFDNIWGKLPDIMKQPYRIAHWFYQHGLNNNEFDFMTLIHYLFDFDKTAAYTSFSNNKYGDFLLDVKDFSTDFITALTGVTASDRVFFTISLGEHFGVAIPDIVIDFDWYAQVKNTFLPWLMAFLYVSVVWLFIKRLPDIIRGVAGDISSFEDALPKDFNNSSFNANTNIMTVTSGTRSRGGTSSSSVSFKVR